MPRSKLVKSKVYPYHVVNRSLDRKIYPFELSEAWPFLMDLCRVITWAYGARIHAFVLMGNHYHMLLSTPDENIGDCMRYFQREFSKWTLLQTGEQRFRFSGRYRYSLLTDPSHYQKSLRYVYQNPVRAGLTKRVGDYFFSTLRGKWGEARLDCPLYPCEAFSFVEPSDVEEEEFFFGDMLEGALLEQTRRALLHSRFKIPKRVRG